MTYGGIFSLTASLKNVLAAQGVSFSEALLLGVSGGLGAGYILWEFKSHESANIVMGFNNRWNYAAERLQTLCERLAIPSTQQETAGVKAAAANLQAALDTGIPFIAWTDKAHLPYQNLPESLKGYIPNIVGVHGLKEGCILLDDLADNLYSISPDDFAAARGRIVSDKNRLQIIGKPLITDLSTAVLTGINDHIAHLSRDSESFSLPAYKKWAKMLTDTRNKKGWPVVFAQRKGLYPTLRSIYEGIVLDGSDGAALRLLYADFLDEAASIIARPALSDAAAHYRQIADQWRALAAAALPDTPFQSTRQLLHQRYDSFKRNQPEATRAAIDQLFRLEADYKNAFPMSDSEVSDLFTSLQTNLNALYEAESAALATLSRVMQ